MSVVARYIGLEEVLAEYTKQDKPNFSMWCKSMPICQYNGDDIDEGIEIITEEINRNVKRQMGHECTLRIHAKREDNYTLKSEPWKIVMFKSYDSTDFSDAANPAVANYKLLEGINRIESRLSALEGDPDDPDDDDDWEEDEQEQEDKISGYITRAEKLLDHPVIGKLIDRLFKTSAEDPNTTKVITSLAGATEDDQMEILNKSLETLFKKGLTLDHLVKLAAMPAAKIKSLLLLI